MKKYSVLGAILAFSLVVFPFCAKETAAPEAGSAKIEDMLNLVPKDALAVFAIDFQKAMETETIQKTITEEKAREGFEKVIEEIGVDPKEDIFFVVAALTEGMGQQEQKGVAILNLKYDRAMLISKVEEEGGTVDEQAYEGSTIFTVKDEGKDLFGSFLDESNIIVGTENEVKAVIDIANKKGENYTKNNELSSLLKKANKKSIFWAAILIPPEAMKAAASQNPMLSALESVGAALLSFNYENKNIMAEIKILSSNEEQNKKVEEFLNGLKAMGSMAAAEDPKIGELLDKISISSSPEHVKISAEIPEELISKLKKKNEVQETEE